MKAIDFIQCNHCKSTLEEFFKQGTNSELPPSIRELVEEYALFAEIRRLRRSKVETEVKQKHEPLRSPLDSTELNKMYRRAITETHPSWGLGETTVIC